MRQVLIVSALALAAFPLLPAQRADSRTPRVSSSTPGPLVIGETFTIASRVLGERRRINVYLPRVYTDSTASRLPVLFMPDGGLAEDFLHIAGLVQVSAENGTMRPFILVGIENTERRRDLTGPTNVESDKRIAPHVGASAAFRSFIRTELMPRVRAQYRTTPETAIIGESLAGLFVVETFLMEPSLFDTYIAIDPSLWWNDHDLVRNASRLLAAKSFEGKTIYIASGRDAGLDELLTSLTSDFKRGAGGLRWFYEAMPDETHATIYHPAALRAVRKVLAPVGPR